MNLLTKIKSKKAVIGIVGLGYVGLPQLLHLEKRILKSLDLISIKKKLIPWMKVNLFISYFR